jgi:hypothetical protein
MATPLIIAAATVFRSGEGCRRVYVPEIQLPQGTAEGGSSKSSGICIFWF